MSKSTAKTKVISLPFDLNKKSRDHSRESLFTGEKNSVLKIILEKALEHTGADRGSIYIVEKEKLDPVVHRRSYILKLKLNQSIDRNYISVAQNPISVQIDDSEFEIKSNRLESICFLKSQIINISNPDSISKDLNCRYDDSVDKKYGYDTRTILLVPIKNVNSEAIGVIKLVNKLNLHRRIQDPKPAQSFSINDILPFSENDENLVDALATNAAIAFQNYKLSQDISRLFESFVKASVMAIEVRDPTTSGHSERVATITVNFAKTLDQSSEPMFKDVKFSPEQIQEIRYASLLHDFGKLGVRETLLQKNKKLYDYELERLLLRFENLKIRNESKMWRKAAEHFGRVILRQEENGDPRSALLKVLADVDRFNRSVEEVKNLIYKANEPQILAGDKNIKAVIAWIKKTSVEFEEELLSNEELTKLTLEKGTLSDVERTEIETHVSHTFRFLSQIDWTDSLARVPEYAYSHHEKLDGSGYPRGLVRNQIPLPAQLMTIADIYDALTSLDRPYKRSVNTTRALDILQIEASEGKIDRNLLRVFVEAELYKMNPTPKVRFKKAG